MRWDCFGVKSNTTLRLDYFVLAKLLYLCLFQGCRFVNEILLIGVLRAAISTSIYLHHDYESSHKTSITPSHAINHHQKTLHSNRLPVHHPFQTKTLSLFARKALRALQ